MTDHTPDNCDICQTLRETGKVVVLPATGMVFRNGAWERAPEVVATPIFAYRSEMVLRLRDDLSIESVTVTA